MPCRTRMSVEDQTEELLAFVKLGAIRIWLRAYEPRSGPLLLVLGRHSWRQQRRERHAIAGLLGRLEFACRGIAARRLEDGPWQDVFPRGVDDAAVTGAEIGGAAALRMTGRDLIRGMLGLLGQRVVVGQPIGPGNAARPVVLVERLDPQIDR